MKKTKILIILSLVCFILYSIETSFFEKKFRMITSYKSYKYQVATIENNTAWENNTLQCDTILGSFYEDKMIKATLETTRDSKCQFYDNGDKQIILLGNYYNSYIEYIIRDKLGNNQFVGFNSNRSYSMFSLHYGRLMTDNFKISYNKADSEDSLMLHLKLENSVVRYWGNDFGETIPIDTTVKYIDQCLTCIKNNAVLDTLLLYEARFNAFSFDRWRGKTPLSEFVID